MTSNKGTQVTQATQAELPAKKLRVHVEIPHLSRSLQLDVSPQVSVQQLVRRVSEQLDLPVFDPDNLRSYDYQLLLDDHVLLDPSATFDTLPTDRHSLVLLRVGRELAISNAKRGTAKFLVADSWSVRDFEILLSSLRVAYEAIFAQNQMLLDRNTKRGYVRDDPLRMHGSIVAHMRADERLLVGRIEINSPGIIEVLGALNPLETIRRFLEDHRRAKAEAKAVRVDRDKDRRHRDKIEQAKAILEIESLKTRVAKERADMLRDAGFPQSEVRPYIEEILNRPLSALAVYQSNGQIECASIEEVESIDVQILTDERDGDSLVGLLPPMPPPPGSRWPTTVIPPPSSDR